MQIKVLYIHHAGKFGGASRSLFELIDALGNQVDARMICQQGKVIDIGKKIGIQFLPVKGVSQFDNSRFGHYRGLRWLILLREFYYLPGLIRSLYKARSAWKDIDVVHINEITLLPAIFFVKRILNKPVVVHVRSVQRNKKGIRNWLITSVINSSSDWLVAIDQTVERSIPKFDVPLSVVHNGINHSSKLSEVENAGNEDERKFFTVAMVGSIIHNKGVFEFVKAAALFKQEGKSIKFLLAGDDLVIKKEGFVKTILRKLKITHDIKKEIAKYIAENDIESIIQIMPFTTNMKSIYDNIDVLCFPSYLNAPGRPVFEAAFSNVPSIVAITQPTADTIVDKQTGLCISGPNVTELYSAIDFLYSNPKKAKEMGKAAGELAFKNFDIHKNATKIKDIYNKLIAVINKQGN